MRSIAAMPSLGGADKVSDANDVRVDYLKSPPRWGPLLPRSFPAGLTFFLFTLMFATRG